MEIHELYINDSEYPDDLRHIPDAPPVLYYAGNLEILKKLKVAIVGTRMATAYGESQAFNFAKEISSRGVCVVSGLAYGIDGAAHRGALEGPGGTIAVLAQALPSISPAAHISLAEKIIERGGLLLSERQSGSILKHEYLLRNRIISGLCKGVLVVEAAERSGSLNTAKHAANQGKDVMAIPGRITDPQSAGSNDLLQKGAHPVLCPKDLGTFLGIPWEQSKICLNPFERKIFEDIKTEAKSAGELAEKYSRNLGELYEILFDLESRNLIKSIHGNRYAALGGSTAGTSTAAVSTIGA